MTEEEIARIRRRLVSMAEELDQEGSVNVRAEDRGDVARADDDERPYQENDQAIASGRNKARSEQAVRVAAALRRLDEDPDAFGTCEVCSEEIPVRRLELLPFVRRCVACQSNAESRPGRTVRKRVTDYVD